MKTSRMVLSLGRRLVVTLSAYRLFTGRG
jgi:hypothetical protein